MLNYSGFLLEGKQDTIHLCEELDENGRSINKKAFWKREDAEEHWFALVRTYLYNKRLIETKWEYSDSDIEALYNQFIGDYNGMDQVMTYEIEIY